MQKILIDENLSPSLASDAQQKGFLCSHVNHLGKTGTKDWELKRVILEGDWTFVTNNSMDFRGPANEPGSSGEYADVRLHAGLACIDAPFGLNLTLLFEGDSAIEAREIRSLALAVISERAFQSPH